MICRFKLWPHQASMPASAMLENGYDVDIGVCCPSINQCQTLGVVRPLHWCLGDIYSHVNISVDGPNSKLPELPCQPDIFFAYNNSRGSRYFEKLKRYLNFYRPQTMFAKVMFSQVSVCPRGVSACGPGGCLPPPGQTPTLGRHPPPLQIPPVHAGIRSTSWRYASHWKCIPVINFFYILHLYQQQ